MWEVKLARKVEKALQGLPRSIEVEYVGTHERAPY